MQNTHLVTVSPDTCYSTKINSIYSWTQKTVNDCRGRWLEGGREGRVYRGINGDKYKATTQKDALFFRLI